MTLKYGFYNSVNHDRLYDATDISNMFDGIILDGVFKGFGNQFAVTATGAQSVIVGSGRAWFNHTWTYNDSDLTVAVPGAPTTNPRYDAVVLQVEPLDTRRVNSIVVISGAEAASPAYPNMVRSGGVYQYLLAYIYRPVATANTTQANIVSGVGGAYCPWAQSSLFVDYSATGIQHRNIFRGKYLGSTYTAVQAQTVRDGIFNDLYIGDYWTVGGINYRIADIDYAYKKVSSSLAQHHLVVIPDQPVLSNVRVEPTNSTARGYSDTEFRNTQNPKMVTSAQSLFGASVLSFNAYLKSTNTFLYGLTKCELLNMNMVYGYQYYGTEMTDDISQIALFRLAPEYIARNYVYWLRSIYDSSSFRCIDAMGYMNNAPASRTSGMMARPYFMIGG